MPKAQPKNLNKIIDLYQQMADLTRPRCASCPAPLTCCAPEYCNIAAEFARSCGVQLNPTTHERLPFMGPTGCVVPPHLRPLCTIHVCELHYMFDAEFSERYFDLRDRIDKIDHQRLNRFVEVSFMNRMKED